MKRRVVSILLVLALVLTSGDFSAFAAERMGVVESVGEEDSSNNEISSINITEVENSYEEFFSTEVGIDETKTIEETETTTETKETEIVAETKETETILEMEETETIIETEETEIETIVEDEINLEAVEGDFIYTITDNTATITGYTGSGGAITIPNVLGGVIVTSIGDSAFYNSAVSHITLPDSITSIGNSAFENCRSLSNLTLPQNLTNMGFWMISGTTITSITIPKNVTNCGEIHGSGPLQCLTLTEVIFEDGMETIPSYILSKTYDVTRVVIPQSVTSIGSNAFSSCTRLKELNLPKSLNTIGNEAFSHCTGLEELNLPDSLNTIGNEAFYRCTGLKKLNLPKTLTAIGGDAFSHCTGLEELNLPDSLNTIGGGAFSNCTGLKELNLPDSLNTIGNGAFYECTGLIKLNLPESLTAIGDSAFYKCTSLVSVKFNYSNEHNITIGRSVFLGCTSLENVDLSENVTSIGNGAFSNCTGLEELSLPEGLTSMGYLMISGTAIKSITIPRNVTHCSYERKIYIDNTVYDSYGGPLANCNTLTEVIFEEGIETIPSYVLSSGIYTSYITKVSFPQSVKSIGDSAFKNCKRITSIEFPIGLKSIGGDAFEGCTGITNVEFPDTVIRIDVGAFDDCKSLKAVKFNYSEEHNITIGSYAFHDCTSLEKINLSENVTSIDSLAFSGCSSLSSLILPKSLIHLGDRMIESTSITSIILPKSLKSCSYDGHGMAGPLANCNTLNEVIFEEGMTKIPRYILAYGDYSSYVNRLIIPDSITLIDGAGDAFYNCNSLTDIYYAGNEKQWKKIVNQVDFNNATIHYNSTGPKDGFYFSATIPTTCIKVGESLEFDVQYYEKDVFDTSIEDVIYVVSDSNVMDVTSGNWDNTKGKHYTVKAKSVGYSTVTFTNPNNGKADVLEFYVVDKETGYALDNVPKFTVEKGKTTNFFNYSGLVVDELQYIPCKDSNGNIKYYYVTMDVYNTLNLYAVVTSYDCNGNLQGFYIVDKMKTQPSNLTGNVKNTYYNIGDLFHLMGNKQYYSGKSISKKTEVEIDVPVGGYIEISNSAMSETVVLTNMVGLIVDSMASSGEFVTGAYDFSESETEIIKAVLMEVFSEKNLAKMITKSIKKSAIDELKHGNWNYSNYGECLNAFMDRLTNLGVDLVDIIADKVASVTGLSSITESVVMRCIPTGDLINFLYDTLGVLDSINMWDSYIQSVYFPRGIYIYAPSADNMLTSNGVKVTPNDASKSNTIIHAYLVLDTSEISGSKYQTYNINMYRDGQKIQPNAPVAVQIPIPSGYSKTNIKVYRLNDDGTITDMDATVTDGYVSFTTEHFSYYALVSGDKGGVFLSHWKFGENSTITLSDLGEQLKGSIVVYAASYNRDGKMLNIVSGDDFIHSGSELQVVFNHQLTKNWELFILDSATYAPLCPSITFPETKQ